MSQSVAAYESAARKKLRLGLTRLVRAGHDAESLGSALVSLHGALEDHVRARIGAHPDVPDEIRQDVLARTDAGWLRLVNLLRTHGNLTGDDAQMMLHVNRLRIQVSHGEVFQGSVQEVTAFADLVRKMVFGESLNSSTIVTPLPSSPSASPSPVQAADPPAPTPDPTSAPGDGPSGSRFARARGLRAILVLLILGASVLALYSGLGPLATVVSGFTSPTPTPLPPGAFWVKNHRPAEMWSGPAGQDGIISFGTTSSQFCSFLVVRPQDNQRLYVLNPFSNNYLWIDADAVGPAPAPENQPGPRPANQNCAEAVSR